ncbi:hypothetical protein [Aurantiacibacter hainanensis]|uniref:hypothetical protein n=1 Tax=Aurantiacibacter hainanensis TaxID=3076114 RepID=UPI0030C7173F
MKPFFTRTLCCALALAVSCPALAQQGDALTATIETDDADRFIALWRESGGNPTAEQLQRRYVDAGSRAVEIFTPGRIESGANLAATIAGQPQLYADAIDRCYPWVKAANGELRATYLALSGLLPDKPLPRIAVLFGADNSGGTAAPGMQVLGLEVLCRLAPDEAAFRDRLRSFFAHETVHTLQDIPDEAGQDDPLLAWALAEGGADYVASLVTGRTINPERDAWARANEGMVWREFAADRAILRDPEADVEERQAAFARWFANAGSPPEGWPSELGYWVGMRIAESHVDRAQDRRAAIRQLLAFDDAGAVLAASDLAGRLAAN